MTTYGRSQIRISLLRGSTLVGALNNLISNFVPVPDSNYNFLFPATCCPILVIHPLDGAKPQLVRESESKELQNK